ncbi:uncharacterized protein LOC133203555 [Saccostrea echinata]|uniref:uncharacterized protein LOC133203555 n=1 Tax=Saccostrea echinata TaxID=191078 RepID=UPI002A7FA400|nr:uncharacterized protein LOC133203555 [Saccostrea echinata]
MNRKIIGLVTAVVLVIVLALAISIPLTLRKENQVTNNPSPLSSCPFGYSGQFCDEPVCTSMCHHGDCVRPDTCNCDPGWTGSACDQAICEMSCSPHGNCTSPNTCTCENGWQGMTCEMPFAPGFNPTMRYIYNISISNTMESDIMMNTDSYTNGADVRQFFSNVNVTFSVSTIKKQSNHSIGILKILNATCHSDFGNQTTDFKNATCDQESAKNLLGTKIMFSQDTMTGKIMNVYYNSSTEAQANFIARLLRFIDCKTAPSNVDKMEETSTIDGKEIYLIRHRLKSETGMQCFNFKREVKNEENMITDREEKEVCMGETGAPQIITMSEFFEIGKNMNVIDSLNDDETNLSPLPSFKGRVFAVGSLVSMKRMAEDDIEDELENVHVALAFNNIKSSPIDEFAFRRIFTEEEYKHSNAHQDIGNLLRHPFPNLRLSLGLDLVRKSKSAISIIGKMIFSQSIADIESRSLLLALLGPSQTLSGQKILMQILDAEEKVKGDHYLALGSVAQLLKPSEDMVSILSKLLSNTLDEDVKTRAALVLGVLGSRGLDHKVVPILTETLFKNNVPHDDICLFISALGNTHSEKATQSLSKILESKETFYKILCIRALKNIPGKKSYKLVLDELLKTRNKTVALQCLKTLKYTGKWINQNDANSILQIAYDTKDVGILFAIKQLFLELQGICTEKQKHDFHAKSMKINGIIAKLQNLEVKDFEVKRESQNFGVYFNMSVDSQIRGSEFDFNANSNLDLKVFGKRINVLEAGSANSLVDSGMFMSSVFMTLKLFGREYDLFMQSWRFELNLGITDGNPCKANNGVIRHTLSEHFQFGDFTFTYGVFGIASVNLKVGLSGPVSFGYGFNIIGNDGDMVPQQVNVVAKPEANLTTTVAASVGAALVRVGVRGDIAVLTGSVQTNVALNLQQRSFCHFVGVNAHVLQGTLYIFGQTGFSFFKRSFERKLFDWAGVNISRTVTESFCCSNAFQSTSETPIQRLYPFLTNVSGVSYKKNMSETLSVLTSINTCLDSVKRNGCPTGLIQALRNKGLHIFDRSLKESYVLTTRHVIPMFITYSGDYYGLDKTGNLVQVNEYGNVKKVKVSLINLLASLGYGREIKQIYGSMIKKQGLLQQQPKLSLIKSTSNVLDLRPYCPKMMAICENIKMGKMYHGDTLTFTENKEIKSFNDKEACSAYIKSNGIRYPYYCEAYPFSFTLQGGGGAKVMSVNVMERDVKMEAFHAFIRSSGLKGGDSFVVIV